MCKTKAVRLGKDIEQQQQQQKEIKIKIPFSMW